MKTLVKQILDDYANENTYINICDSETGEVFVYGRLRYIPKPYYNMVVSHVEVKGSYTLYVDDMSMSDGDTGLDIYVK